MGVEQAEGRAIQAFLQLKPMSVSKHILPAIFLGIIGIVFYMLMVFTPLFSDDWNYYLVFGTGRRIQSLWDIFVSQYNHYFLNNGRFIPHFFVQLFDGILGKGLFNIVNTIVFLVFILLLIRVKGKTEWRLLPILLALLLLLMPGFNNAFLWMSGACNYLWAAVLILLFYKLLTRDKVNGRYYPLLLLFGILCGWTNEALIVGFVAGCLCYYLIYRKELTSHRAVLLAGLIIGALFLTLAPGSVHRFLNGKEGAFSITGFTHQLLASLLAMDNLRLLPLLLLTLLSLAVFKKIPKGFFSENLLWLVAVGVSFVFVLMTGHQAAHSRFGIELFSLVLILRLMDHFAIPKSVVVTSGLIACIVLALTAYYSYLNNQEFRRCVAQIQSTGTGIIETDEVKWPSFFDRLVVRFKPSENDDYYYYQSDWIDRYYGKDNLLFMPHRFMERIRNDVGAYEVFDVNTDLPFYAKRTDVESVESAVFHLSEPVKKDIPLLLRPIAGKMERYSAKEVKTNDLSVVTLPQGRFILVMKNHMIADRVESITFQ